MAGACLALLGLAEGVVERSGFRLCVYKPPIETAGGVPSASASFFRQSLRFE